MTCRRAIEADLLALVHGEADADLRAHVDGCADCAAELEVWRELDGLLQAGAGGEGAHPEPEALVALVDAPASLAPDARAAVERHVAGCRVCADEIRSLRTFSAAAVGAAGPVTFGETAAAAASARAPRGSVAAAGTVETTPAPGARRGLGAVLWHPAFAYALVVALLVPLVRDQLPKLRYDTRAVDARRDAPPLPPAAPVEPALRAEQRKAEQRSERVAAVPPPVAATRPAEPPSGVAAAPARPNNVPETARRAPAADAHGAVNAGGDAGRGLADETAASAPDAAFAKRAVPVPADERRQRLAAAAPPAASNDRDAEQDEVDVAANAPRQAMGGNEGAARGATAEAVPQPRAPEAPPPAGGPTDGAAREAASGAGRAVAASGPSVGGAGSVAPVVLAVEAGRPTIFDAEVLGRPALLRLAPPADLARGPLTVTVRARANGRELVRLGINEANAIAVAIPADWLASGDYVVTLQPVANGKEPAPALLGFSVRAPTAR